MRLRSVIVPLLVLLLALTALLVVQLPNWRSPAHTTSQALQVEDVVELVKADNVSAIWYNLETQRLYGHYGQVSDSVDNLPRNADFYAELSPEEFWTLATQLKAQGKGAIARGNLVVGYVRDPQSIWQRYRSYWIFCLALLLVGVIFIVWLRSQWKHKQNSEQNVK